MANKQFFNLGLNNNNLEDKVFC